MPRFIICVTSPLSLLALFTFKTRRIVTPIQELYFLVKQRNSKIENAAARPSNSSETMIVRQPILAFALCARTPKIGQRYGLRERNIWPVQFDTGAAGDVRSKLDRGDSGYEWNFPSFLLLGEQDNPFSRTPSFVSSNPSLEDNILSHYFTIYFTSKSEMWGNRSDFEFRIGVLLRNQSWVQDTRVISKFLINIWTKRRLPIYLFWALFPPDYRYKCASKISQSWNRALFQVEVIEGSTSPQNVIEINFILLPLASRTSITEFSELHGKLLRAPIFVCLPCCEILACSKAWTWD
jgi:hypothetical protein